MRAVACALIVLVVFAPRSASASSFGVGSGAVEPAGTVEVDVRVQTPGIDTPVDITANTATPQVIWDTSDAKAKLGLDGLCSPSSAQLGSLFHVLGRDRETDAIVYDQWVCVPIDPANSRPAPRTPALPTIEEAWRAAHLPPPAIHVDPPERGITGLDTVIETAEQRPVTIDASIRGYTITGTAIVTGYSVQIDGGAPTRTTTAHHVFETKGLHTITVGVIWHGVDTLTGPDLEHPITATIGDADVTITRTYQVDEIRSVLQP
jgi:hypothetical protein